MLQTTLFAPPILNLAILFFSGTWDALLLADNKGSGNPPPPTVGFNGFGAVALSPDGKWLAASGAPGTTVRLWDTGTGKEIRALPGHDSEVMMAVFARDGRRLFTATTNEVRVWDIGTGKQLQRIPASPTWQSDRMTLSGDQKWFVSDPDLAPKFAPDDRLIIATVRLWEVATGREARRFEIVRSSCQLWWQSFRDCAEYLIKGVPRSDEILGTAVRHDGKWVAAGTWRGVVHLWDASTGKLIRTFGGSDDCAAIPLGMSKDGKWLATRVYALPTLPLLYLWGEGRRGATKPPVVIRLWDVAASKQKYTIRGDVCDPSRSITDDGKWLITVCEQNRVKIWELETGNEVRAFPKLDKAITHCSISADKKRVVTCDGNDTCDGMVTARLWDVATGRELRALKIQTRQGRVSVSADAKLLAGWSPSRLTLWDMETGQEIRSMIRKVDE